MNHSSKFLEHRLCWHRLDAAPCACNTPRGYGPGPRSSIVQDPENYRGWAAMCPDKYCQRPCPNACERVNVCWCPGQPICSLDQAAIAWLRFGAITPHPSIHAQLRQRYAALNGMPPCEAMAHPGNYRYMSYPRTYGRMYGSPYAMRGPDFHSGMSFAGGSERAWQGALWGDSLPFYRGGGGPRYFSPPFGGVPNYNHMRALAHAQSVAARGGTAYYDGVQFGGEAPYGYAPRGTVRSLRPRMHSLEAPDLTRFHGSRFSEIRDWADRLDQIADRTSQRGDRVYMGQIRNTPYEMQQAEQMLQTVDQARLEWSARGAPVRTVAMPLPLSGDHTQIRIERLKEDGSVESSMLYQPNSRRISWSPDMRLVSEHGVIPTRDSNTDRNGTPRPYSGQITFYKPGRYRVNGRVIEVSAETRQELTKRLELKERELVDVERQIHEITEEMEAANPPLGAARASPLLSLLRELCSQTSTLRTSISQLRDEVREFASPRL